MNASPETLRTVDRSLVGARDRPEGLPCEAPGCLRATSRGKPYCLQHVTANPHAGRLLARMSAQEVERRRVQRLGVRAVDLRGETLGDLLLRLRDCEFATASRLARDLGLGSRLTRIYLRAAHAAGLTRSIPRTGLHRLTAAGLARLDMAEPQAL